MTTHVICMETKEGLLGELEPFVITTVDEVHSNSTTVQWEGVVCFSKRCLDLTAGVDSVDTKRYLYKRFVEQCAVQSKLRHPNILQFLGVYRREIPFDIMMLTEHMSTSLDKHLRLSPPLHLYEKASILVDVSKGLRYMHSRHPAVAHGELTARNVFLDEDNRAKIGDLGVLTILDESVRHINAWEKAADSLLYVAPEAKEKLGQRSLTGDVYSFGVLARFVATQVPPSEDPATAEMSENIRSNRNGHALGMEQRLHEVINQCLDNTPLSRPTAAKLCDNLKILAAKLETDVDSVGRKTVRRQTSEPQKNGVMIDLKRIAKLQAEMVEAKNQIKQIENALKEVKTQLEARQKIEQEILEKVSRELEAKDKELQSCKVQLEELKNDNLKLKESRPPPPIPDRLPLSNVKPSDSTQLAGKPSTPTEVCMRAPAKSSPAATRPNKQRNSTYLPTTDQAEEEVQAYEEPVEILSTQPWFCANLDAISSEARLRTKNWSGAYLVRESKSMKGQYTLSLLYNNEVRHMRIHEPHPKRYSMDSVTFFSSVRSLIQHYHSHPIYLETGGKAILKDEN